MRKRREEQKQDEDEEEKEGGGKCGGRARGGGCPASCHPNQSPETFSRHWAQKRLELARAGVVKSLPLRRS
eukprot:6695773-Pyramimonas_sp.AAC.1